MLNDSIEQLALTKNFDELDAGERALVLTQMSQEAYDSFRAVLRAARQMDAEAAPPADLKLRLLRQLATQPRTSLWSRVLRRQVSVWQAVAAAMVLVGGTWFLARQPVPTPTAPAILAQVQRDTIRDTIWQEKIVWRERVQIQHTMPMAAAQYADTTNLPLVVLVRDSFPSIFNVQFSTFNSPGTSMGDVPELFDFLTESRK